MVADQASRPWTSPVSPLVVERRYVEVAPFAAGGHRSVRLRVPRGAPVRSPCTGVVAFRGSVAGSPLTLTVACGANRATLRWVRSGEHIGATVVRGEFVGAATAAAIGFSARLGDGSYIDPLGLLAPGSRARPTLPPAVVGRVGRGRASRAAGRQHIAPIHLPASAFARAGSDPVAGFGARSGRRHPAGPAAASASRGVDIPLTVGGLVALLVPTCALAVAWARRPRTLLHQWTRADLARNRR